MTSDLAIALLESFLGFLLFAIYMLLAVRSAPGRTRSKPRADAIKRTRRRP